MATLDDVRRLGAAEQGLAVISTTRADGTVQSSLINGGVMRHPRTGAEVVAFVARGGAVKLRNLRARPRATILFRSGWRYACVEGATDLAGPDDPGAGLDADALRLLLREIFISAGGTHDDWDAYDRVMAEERRTAVFIAPERIYGVA
jgi:PPOX class probable F420-dependent enzyme